MPVRSSRESACSSCEPRAAQPFALVARVEFAPAPGSIRCNVWIGGKRVRDIRLVWDDPTARCYLRLPAGARGKRLTVGLARPRSAVRSPAQRWRSASPERSEETGDTQTCAPCHVGFVSDHTDGRWSTTDDAVARLPRVHRAQTTCNPRRRSRDGTVTPAVAVRARRWIVRRGRLAGIDGSDCARWAPLTAEMEGPPQEQRGANRRPSGPLTS